MNAKTLRARADRCRELHRVAVRDDIREQLRHGQTNLTMRQTH